MLMAVLIKNFSVQRRTTAYGLMHPTQNVPITQLNLIVKVWVCLDALGAVRLAQVRGLTAPTTILCPMGTVLRSRQVMNATMLMDVIQDIFNALLLLAVLGPKRCTQNARIIQVKRIAKVWVVSDAPGMVQLALALGCTVRMIVA